jgi:type I restriction enzyme S subunit
MFVTPSDNFDKKYLSTTIRKLSLSGCKKLSSKLLPIDSIMVTCIGSDMGKISMNAAQAITNQQINSIKIDISRYNAHYVYYKLINSYNILRQYATGSTAVPLLNKTDFCQIEIGINDDIGTQQKIASVLSALDSKIEVNNRINAGLEAMAKTLYDYWFVQFEFPDTNGKPYKSSGGKMVWNEELKREVPEGWEVKSLFDIADYINGLPCQKFRPINHEFLRVIKIKEMNDGFSINSELVRPNIPQKAIIQNGDILFSWSASLEVKIWTGGIGALNQHIFKVVSNKYPKSFYYFQLVNYLQHFKMMAENRKTTMGHITQDHLLQSRIILPPIELVSNLEKIISPILEKKINNEIENQTLSSLRDWLLPMLMNGQVKVGENEKEVREAAIKGKRIYHKKQKELQAMVIAKLIKKYTHVDKLYTLGRTKVEKNCHIIENKLGIDLGRMPGRLPHGPADFDYLVNEVEPYAKENGWFEVYQKKNEKVIYNYRIKNNFKFLIESAEMYFKEKEAEINRIIDLLLPLDAVRSEVVATTYAAWNDLLLMGKNPTDDEITKEARENWQEEKLKIEPYKFELCIKWLRKYDLVPEGKGKSTRG